MGMRTSTLVLLVLLTVCLRPALQAAEIVRVEAATSPSQSVLGSTVIPYKEVTLAAQTPGVVKLINGEVGSTFKAGDVLTQVDDSQLLARRQALMAQLTNAQAAIQNA